ncbi:MAG: hypothetical protein EBW90_09445, partial [Rhodobacteraceae bacterium]|nr:hypothetical protein [Paracoccaceae bacterium]
KEQNFYMTLNEFKIIFWWEWAHRQLGRLIGLTVLFPMIYFFCMILLIKSSLIKEHFNLRKFCLIITL